MNIIEALSIVESLADGIDPITGEVFPPESPYQHPQIIRSLYTVIYAFKETNAQKIQTLPRKNTPTNTGKPWSAEDDAALVRDFDMGISLRQLAAKLQRTIYAIEVRLLKLGRNPENPNERS